MAELVGGQDVFPLCAIRIIVTRIAIHKPVEEYRVKGESPVLWGGIVCVAIPPTRVVEGVCRCLVLIEIPVRFLWKIWQGLSNAYEYCNNDKVTSDGSEQLHSE